MEPVPVTFVSSHSRAGGSERYLLNLVEQLDRRWIDTVIALEEGPLVESLSKSGVSVEIVPIGNTWPSMLSGSLALRRTLRRSGTAVVHANGVKAALACVLSGTGIPIVWLKHDISKDGIAARLIAARCSVVVGVSNFVMQIFRPPSGRKFRVVHTGIQDLDPEPKGARRALVELIGHDVDAIVGLVGRLDPYKGQLELIEAAPEVLRAVPGAHFLLVGGPSPDFVDWAPRLERRVEELKLEDRVIFASYRSDATSLMAGFDVAVIPTVADRRGRGREGFSLVGLEYLESGVPVVAYDDGGLPELLGPCGRLVASGDRRELAAAIVGLLRDEDARRALAECGRERVRLNFRARSMVDALTGIYWEASR